MVGKMSKFSLALTWKIFFGFCSLIFLAFAYYNLSDFRSANWFDIFVALVEIVVALFYFIRLFDMLSMNEEGFIYRSLGIDYSGKWVDVKTIDERENALVDLVRLEGILILTEKLSKSRNWFASRKYFFIPLSQFARKWRESELGSKVQEYLPQVQWKQT
jgi:hypothetical protein